MRKPELVDAAPLMAAILGPASFAIEKAVSHAQPLDAACSLNYLNELRTWATLVLHLLYTAIAHAAAGGGAGAIVVRIVSLGLGLPRWN